MSMKNAFVTVAAVIFLLTAIQSCEAQQEAQIPIPIGITTKRLPDGVWQFDRISDNKPKFWDRVFDLYRLKPINAQPFRRSVAFLVGVGNYSNFPQLPFVNDDLTEFRNFLLTDAGFDTVFELRDASVTRSLIEDYMVNKFGNESPYLSRDDRLLFYYSGRAQDKHSGFLQFSHAKANILSGDDVLPVSQFREWAKINVAKHLLVVLDACVSGSIFETLGGPSTVDGLLNTLSGQGSGFLLTAGTAFQLRNEQKGYSIFTHALLDALRYGSSDSQSRDFLTVEEVFARVQRNIAQFELTTGLRMNPQLIALDRYAGRVKGTFVFLNPIALTPKTRDVARYLELRIMDIQQRPIGGLEIGTKGGASTAVSARSGVVRLKLAPAAKAGDWISLQIIASPKQMNFAFVSPWNGRALIPPFDAEPEARYLPVIVTSTSRLNQFTKGRGVVRATRNMERPSLPAPQDGWPADTTLDIEADASIFSGTPVALEIPGISADSIEILERGTTIEFLGNAQANSIISEGITQAYVRVKSGTQQIAQRVYIAKELNRLKIFRSPYGRSYAAVVALSAYAGTGFNDAKGTIELAEQIAKELERQGFHVERFYDGKATAALIDEYFRQTLSRTTKDDRVLFYYLGHGAFRDLGKLTPGYLVTYGAKASDYHIRGLPMARFREEYADLIPAKHVLFVLDTCYAGSATTLGEPKSEEELRDIRRLKQIEQYTTEPMRNILASSRKDQRSINDNGGIFSHYFLEAIQGRADFDHNGVITMEELFAYIKPRVVDDARANGALQTPELDLLDKKGQGDFIFLYR
jgi:uncharacterized caspase-like protein